MVHCTADYQNLSNELPVGRGHLALALGLKAAERVRFYTAADLVRDLVSGRRQERLEAVLRGKVRIP